MNGNRQSEKTLYDKYKKIIYDFLKHKYNPVDIDDDVSEILVKMFFGLSTYDNEKSKFKSWVLSIASNFMIDKWRNGIKYKETLSTNDYHTINGTQIDWACTSSQNNFTYCNTSCYTVGIDTTFENKNALTYLSTQVSSADYCLLNMKYVEGYDYNEIGKEFNITSSTVSNRINYIKTKLKKNNLEMIE